MQQSARRVDAQKVLGEKPPSKRRQIAVKLGHRLKNEMTELEQELAWAIARQLAEDAAQMVREALAMSVRECTFLPKDIGFQLACDIDTVAVPFLEVTQIFSEAELFEIARSVTDTVRLTIAGRSALPSSVCAALIELGNLKVAEELMTNRSASIKEQDYRVLFDRFPCEQTLFERMAARALLPPTIVTELISIVSDSLREQLQIKYKIKEDYSTLISDEVHEEALMKAISACPKTQTGTLARIIHSKGRLTRNICFLAIRNGNLAFFESSLAVLSREPELHVREIVRKGSVETITEICKKAKMPEFIIREVCQRIMSIREDLERVSA